MAYIPKITHVWKWVTAKRRSSFSPVCGRCSREFVYSNLRELTVHHIDHDHPITRKMAATGRCCACTVTITNIPSTPKPISMAPRWWQGKMRKERRRGHLQPVCRSESDDEQK